MRNIPNLMPLFVMLITATGSAEIVSFTSFDLFLEVVEDFNVIDFATLPDGSSSVPGTPITSEFNYTSQGALLSSPFPDLAIGTFDEVSGFPIMALNPDSSERNWITINFSPPILALGVFFPGTTTLSVNGIEETLLGSVSHGGSGPGWFAGFLSDTPIYSAVADRGASFQSLDSVLFAPVPEPVTLVLLAIGAVAILGQPNVGSLGAGGQTNV